MSVTLPISPAETLVECQQPKLSRLATMEARVKDSHALSSLMAIADQGMISGTNFVTAVIIGRYCGAETLGLFALVASAMAMIIGIQDQLITAPYVLYHNRRHGLNLQRYMGSVLIHHCIFIAIVTFGMLACLVGVSGSEHTVRIVTLVLLLGAPAILLRTFIREISLAHCNVLTVVAVDAAVCVTRLVTVAVMLTVDDVNLPVIYAVLGITCLVTATVWMIRNWSEFSFCKQSTIISWYRNWRFGRWAMATHLAGTSTPYLMPWVLFVMHGEAATGFLASCSVIVGVCNIMLAGMCDFMNPRSAAAYADGGISALRKIQRTMLFISVLTIGSVCVIAALFGEQIINTLYDGKFAGAGGMVTWLTLSVLANAIGMAAGSGLWAIDRPRANFTADMVTLTVAIIAALTLVGPYGAPGAAIATFSASLAGAICRQVIFQRAARELSA